MGSKHFFLLVACCLVPCSGCSSGDAFTAGTRVTGKVTLNGAPVSGARVIFTEGNDQSPIPTGPTALTDEEGNYALAGVKPGSYKVVVHKLVAKGGGAVPTDDEGGLDLTQIEASGAGTHALPIKYSRTASTTLVVEVPSGSHVENLELKGK